MVEIVWTEHVCFSASAFMDCERFPACEHIQAVYASPAGEIHSCKLMIYTVSSICIPLAVASVRHRLVHMGCAR